MLNFKGKDCTQLWGRGAGLRWEHAHTFGGLIRGDQPGSKAGGMQDSSPKASRCGCGEDGLVGKALVS